jgi:hypothetical protein
MGVDYRLVPIALWALAGILVLAAYLTSSVGLLVAAAVLAVGGSIVRSIDRLRDDLRAARIAAELGGTGAPPLETIASLALLTPVPPPTPAVPLARPYTRPPWEKDPQEAP